jgi:glycosyltransferase involved in cell wall biosynthesis
MEQRVESAIFMRILVINYEFPPLGGGAGSASLCVARELTQLNCHVTLMTSRFKNLPHREIVEGADVIRIPVFRKRSDRCTIPEMISFMVSGSYYGLRIMKKEKPDAVLSFFTIPCSHIGLLGKWFKGIPYIVSLRGGDVPGSQPEQLAAFHFLTKPIVKILWRNAAAVVANSAGLGTLAKQTLPNLDVKIIPNGVDLGQYSPREKKEDIASNNVRFLFVGRASPEKNLSEAFSVLRDYAALNWSFSIIGDGPKLPGWKKEVETMGLGDRVVFHGWKPKMEMPQIYRDFDVFLFPSTSEGMPNAVLEAMASGLPVVATRIRGNEDIVEHEINGYLYEPGDMKSLGSCLMRLMKDPSLRSRMGIASRRRAENFSWRRTAEEYLTLLNKAAGKRSCE